jgi:alkylhydroperoxidase/carboxymuconolactone decarboxylase family protein YurZ
VTPSSPSQRGTGPGTTNGRETEMADVDLTEDTPVLTTLAMLTAVSVESCSLEPRDLMLARIAALAAVGAPPASYVLNAGAASDAGITLEDVQGILIAVAPIIGTPRTLLAAGNITRALGFAIAALESELEDESN